MKEKSRKRIENLKSSSHSIGAFLPLDLTSNDYLGVSEVRGTLRNQIGGVIFGIGNPEESVSKPKCSYLRLPAKKQVVVDWNSVSAS